MLSSGGGVGGKNIKIRFSSTFDFVEWCIERKFIPPPPPIGNEHCHQTLGEVLQNSIMPVLWYTTARLAIGDLRGLRVFNGDDDDDESAIILVLYLFLFSSSALAGRRARPRSVKLCYYRRIWRLISRDENDRRRRGTVRTKSPLLVVDRLTRLSRTTRLMDCALRDNHSAELVGREECLANTDVGAHTSFGEKLKINRHRHFRLVK